MFHFSKVYFQRHSKLQEWLLPLKKKILNFILIIIPSLFYQFLANCIKNEFILAFTRFWQKLVGLLKSNLVLEATTLQTMHRTQQTFVGLQDVLKTSSRPVLKTSSTRLQRNNFSSSKRSSRRLEDISQGVLKTSWKTRNCYAEDVLKTSWRYVLKMSWRRLGDNKLFTGDICI